MQKSIKFTILIIVAILIYTIYSQTALMLNYNFLYYYIINPLFWILSVAVLVHIFGEPTKKYKLKKEISYYTVVAILVYVITYIISGLFLTYGKNPYSTTFWGILTNIWILGAEIILKEIVRYYLINNVYEKDKTRIAILISIVYIISDFGLWKLSFGKITNVSFIKDIAQTILPSAAKNLLCSYICLNTTCIPAVAYSFITEAYFWISPILPNSSWIMIAIIDTTIPVILFLYIRYIKYKKSFFKSREIITSTSPGAIIPLVVVVILSIWFAIGIFPIKPISIATGSMEKELHVGDVAIIHKLKADEIIVGDIIEYRKENYTVVHRVIKKYKQNGELYFITKGDNNNTSDKDPVHSSQLIGKVVFKVRYLGYPAIWLRLLQAEQAIEQPDSL